MTPLKFHTDYFEEIDEKIDQLQMQKVVEVHPKDNFDRDRFKEINEKLEKVTKFVELPEKSGIATPPIVMAPPQVRALCRSNLSNTKPTPSSIPGPSWTNYPNTRIDFRKPNGPNAGTPSADLHQ